MAVLNSILSYFSGLSTPSYLLRIIEQPLPSSFCCPGPHSRHPSNLTVVDSLLFPRGVGLREQTSWGPTTTTTTLLVIRYSFILSTCHNHFNTPLYSNNNNLMFCKKSKYLLQQSKPMDTKLKVLITNTILSNFIFTRIVVIYIISNTVDDVLSKIIHWRYIQRFTHEEQERSKYFALNN